MPDVGSEAGVVIVVDEAAIVECLDCEVEFAFE
jgi:hypothetical protein